MVHLAQSKCADWIYQLERSRQGVPGAPSAERARRELHSAVMLYWTQIRRFRHRDDIEKVWTDKPLDKSRYRNTTLDELGKLRLKEQATTELVWNDDRGREETQQVREPYLMPPDLSLAAHDRLDECAQKLGFDAKPEDQTIYPEPA